MFYGLNRIWDGTDDGLIDLLIFIWKMLLAPSISPKQILQAHLMLMENFNAWK